MPDFGMVVPEIFLLCAACVVLVVDLYLSDATRWVTYALAQVSLIVTAFLVWTTGVDGSQVSFNGLVVRDLMADLLKIVALLLVAATFVYSHQYLRERQLGRGEYYVLGLFASLGMLVMISAHSMLTVYLGLELLSLSLYALVAFNRDSPVSTESGMKYFVLGALASGMLLYGMSMLYGVSGTLLLPEIAAYLRQPGDHELVALFGLSFVVVGLAFKLGAVPFHMWIPDVYHGAPTSVALLIGTAPKIAAFAMVMRMLVGGLEALHADWQEMLVILSVLSLVIGNVVAIAQVNIKRMLAYSTISHVGFILLGVLAGTEEGYASAMFYTITYTIMAAGAFGMILLLSRAGFEADALDDFKGLNERSPWFAFMMLIMMFSMAGVPPAVGFYAKLLVLRAVVDVGLVWLAVVAVAASLVGAFYYLRVVKLMYFDRPEDTAPLAAGADMRLVMSGNGLAVLGLGLLPGGLMGLCLAAVP